MKGNENGEKYRLRYTKNLATPRCQSLRFAYIARPSRRRH